MNEQNEFLGMLKDIADIARVNGNSITTKEIDEYFSDMRLTSEQMELVYDYLCNGQIHVIGHAVPKINNQIKPKVDNKEKTSDITEDRELDSFKDSQYSKIYRKSAKEKQCLLTEDLDVVCAKLINGKASRSERDSIVENYLSIVVNTSSKYVNKGVSADELIQEGNLALVLAVNNIMKDSSVLGDINNNSNASKSLLCEKYFRNCIRQSMIELVDDEVNNEAELSAAVGKAQLVNEAVKHLAAELGRVASVKEVSEYTHICETEIEDIVTFSGKAISIGDGKDDVLDMD